MSDRDDEIAEMRNELRTLRYALAALCFEEGGPISVSRTELRDLRPDIALDICDDPATNTVVFRLVVVEPNTGAITPLGAAR